MTQRPIPRTAPGAQVGGLALAAALALALAGCGSDGARSTTVTQTKTVEDVLEERAQRPAMRPAGTRALGQV